MDTSIGARDSMRILYVDDDELYGCLVQLAFRQRGHELALCLTLEAAQALLDEDPTGWDLAFVDFRLPRTDGAEVVASLRTRLPQLPCLILTGLVTPAVLEAARASGAVQSLTKPLEAEHLVAVARLHARTGG